MLKTSIKYLRVDLKRKREKGMKWREVGKLYPDVPLGTLCRIAKDETYEPKSPTLRAHIGLSPLPVQVSPCPKCGQLHAFARRCPGAATKYAPHPVMRISKIKRTLEVLSRDGIY